MRMEDLLRDSGFAAASAVQRVGLLDQRIAEQSIRVAELEPGTVARLLWEALPPGQAPDLRLTEYAGLRKRFVALPPTMDLEIGLALDLLQAENNKTTDARARMKRLQELFDSGAVIWPTLETLQTGLLVEHLAVHRHYAGWPPQKKLEYLNTLVTSGDVSRMVASHFAKTVALAWVTQTPEAGRDGVISKIETVSDFFTTRFIRDSFSR